MDNKFSLIIGGSGFVGNHLINELEPNYLNLDIISSGNNYKYCDVRDIIDMKFEGLVNTIYNLAAIHMTPGHKYEEYFDTNINGAKNVCNLARSENINTIIFTSSIAPYGTWEDEKNEDSMPLPTSAYGISKLVAEEIHKRWQAEKPDERKLIIVRPGVVFGRYESGNFTRLYNALKSGRFFYPGRKNTKKGAIYVKDLVRLMVEMAENEKAGSHLYNMVYTPVHTIQEICQVFKKVTGVKEPKFKLPATLLRIVALIINIIGKLIGKSFDGIHPDRVNKLMISTNINGQKLLDNNYTFNFTLEEAINDWYNDCNKEELE